MKKIVFILFSVFCLLFVAGTLTVHFANDKLYALLYKPNQVIMQTSKPRDNIKLHKGDYFVCGSYSGDKLVWRCVSDKTAQCNNVVEFRAYDSSNSNWDSSELCQWLNSKNGFLKDSELVGSGIVKGGIRILSKSELIKIDVKSRLRAPTLSAIRNSNSKYIFIRKYIWYWTSSKVKTNSSSVVTVTQAGGFYKALCTDGLTGICPAFDLSGDSISVLGGNGSLEKPYVIG